MVKRTGLKSGGWLNTMLPSRLEARKGVVPLGVLPGEGIGPEVIDVALRVLAAAGPAAARRLEVRLGGPIGRDAELLCGEALTTETAEFCESVFAAGGAVLAGPGGGRFVYDLRSRFDLFCKISPICPSASRPRLGRLAASDVGDADVLIVRENSGGIYMGESSESTNGDGERVCEHRFRYSEREVGRILEAAAKLAAQRRGMLAVVVKDGGMPAMTALWREMAEDVAGRLRVRVSFLNIDLAAYALVQKPRDFDVVVGQDLFGDVLADVGALLLGGRGLSFSGNFSASGAAVYQTNHGGAADIAGTDRANPLGQIFALAFALRESLGLPQEAAWIEEAIDEVLRQGLRTSDIADAGSHVVGTREMGEQIAAAVHRLSRSVPRPRGGDRNWRPRSTQPRNRIAARS